jgi:hypothetical protein
VLAEVHSSAHELLPVRRFDGTLQVLVTTELWAVPADDRDLRRVQDLARPAVLLGPDEPVRRLLDAPAVPEAGLPATPFGLVVQGDTVLGVVGPAQLARADLAGHAASAGRVGPDRPNGPWSTGR